MLDTGVGARDTEDTKSTWSLASLELGGRDHYPTDNTTNVNCL